MEDLDAPFSKHLFNVSEAERIMYSQTARCTMAGGKWQYR